MSDPSKIDQALALLEHTRSAKRRSGARTLRKLRPAHAGSALLRALRLELEDPRTWETQYQMIMALGECGHREALPFLRELTRREIGATMLYVALGDAIVRLSSNGCEDRSAVLELMRGGNPMLVQGAFRAMAMLRMVPTPSATDKMIEFALEVEGQDDSRGVWMWLAAAAPGWTGGRVEDFLERCIDTEDAELVKVAEAASKGKYLKFNPL